MGGRIRLLVVGSAPLSGTVLTFVRCALGCVVSILILMPNSHIIYVKHKYLVYILVVRFFTGRGRGK